MLKSSLKSIAYSSPCRQARQENALYAWHRTMPIFAQSAEIAGFPHHWRQSGRACRRNDSGYQAQKPSSYRAIRRNLSHETDYGEGDLESFTVAEKSRGLSGANRSGHQAHLRTGYWAHKFGPLGARIADLPPQVNELPGC